MDLCNLMEKKLFLFLIFKKQIINYKSHSLRKLPLCFTYFVILLIRKMLCMVFILQFFILYHLSIFLILECLLDNYWIFNKLPILRQQCSISLLLIAHIASLIYERVYIDQNNWVLFAMQTHPRICYIYIVYIYTPTQNKIKINKAFIKDLDFYVIDRIS